MLLPGPFAKPGGERKCSQASERKKEAGALLRVSLPNLEALGGAGQLSDKICFHADCRNTLALSGKQLDSMQHLRDELASLAAEINTMKKVILHFEKEGRALSGQLVGFPGSAHTPHPLPGDAG